MLKQTFLSDLYLSPKIKLSVADLNARQKAELSQKILDAEADHLNKTGAPPTPDERKAIEDNEFNKLVAIEQAAGRLRKDLFSQSHQKVIEALQNDPFTGDSKGVRDLVTDMKTFRTINSPKDRLQDYLQSVKLSYARANDSAQDHYKFLVRQGTPQELALKKSQDFYQKIVKENLRFLESDRDLVKRMSAKFGIQAPFK